MLKKALFAMLVVTVSIGLAAAEEFGAVVKKVEGDKVTFVKTKKGKEDGEAQTLPVADKATIANGTLNKEDKKYEKGDAIEGGLKASIFQKIGDKGLAVRITTADDNKSITQILVTKKKGK